MKKLKYVNGHFYDANTKKRVRIIEHTEISVPLENILEAPDKIGEHPKLKDSKEKERQVDNDLSVDKKKKVLNAGTRLYFKIMQHEFEVELLEDLYFYLAKDKKKDDKSRLYDCACVVRSNPTKTIQMFEEIFAKSLNQIYKNTYVHYFGNKGAPSCNAFDRFYEDKGKGLLMINQYREIIEKANKQTTQSTKGNTIYL